MKILFIWVSGATAQRNRVFCHFLFLAESLLFLSRGWRRQQPVRTRSTSRSPEIPDSFCAPHQDRTKQDRRCCHVTWYFLTSSGPIPLACVASRTCLDNLSCGILRTRGRINVIVILLFGGGDWHSRLYEFHSCALCREASRRKLFAKIPSMPLARKIPLFQPLLKIHHNRWGSEQRPIWKLTALRCLTASVLWPQSDRAHANCFATPVHVPICVFYHSQIYFKIQCQTTSKPS